MAYVHILHTYCTVQIFAHTPLQEDWTAAVHTLCKKTPTSSKIVEAVRAWNTAADGLGSLGEPAAFRSVATLAYAYRVDARGLRGLRSFALYVSFACFLTCVMRSRAPGLLPENGVAAEEFSAALKAAHLAIRPSAIPSGAAAVHWDDSALPFAGAEYEAETASEVHGRGVQAGMSWISQRDGPGVSPTQLCINN